LLLLAWALGKYRLCNNMKYMDDNDIQELTLPPLDESAGSTTYTPFQSYNLNDTSFNASEGGNLVDGFSSDREHDCTKIESIDASLQVDK
jgi:hypothetical protein